MSKHPARENIQGFSTENDRLWLIHTPEFSAGITEYNDELTGYDPRFADLDKAFHYGGNAYYILGSLAEKRGWRVEPIEDRR